MSMKIDEAVAQLQAGKTINSANAQATIKPREVENSTRVTVTRKRRDGQTEEMDLTLSRMRQLYMAHDFALGSYNAPGENKAAKAPETK